MTGSANGLGAPSAPVPDFSDVPDIPDAASRLRELPAELSSRTRLVSAPTRSDVQRRRWIALGVVAFWALAQIGALGVRFDFSKLPMSYIGLTFLLPLVLGIVGLAAAVQPGRAGLGAGRQWLVALILLGPLSVIGTALLLPEPYAGGIAGDRASIFTCGNLALGWAAVPITAAALALRGAFVAGAVWRSALVGTACGLGAALAAQVRCPVTGALHIVLAHGGVVVSSVLLGAFVLTRATRV